MVTKPRVAVLFGGRSPEHAISCITAAGVLNAIDRERYEVIPIGVTRQGHWVPASDEVRDWQLGGNSLPEVPEATQTVLLSPERGQSRELVSTAAAQMPEVISAVDVVFPLFHGPYGEDGTIQGFFELAQIPYVGAGVLASAVGMDKEFMKIAFQHAGLKVGPYLVIRDRQWQHDPQTAVERAAELGFPLFVKPARAGSSVGIRRVERREDLAAAIEYARAEDPKVIIEAAISGREIECGVLQGRGSEAPRTSLPGEIVTQGNHELYDFEAKYLDEDGAALTCPADLPADVIAEIRRQAAIAFEAIDAEGLSRVDFFYTDTGDVVINEINTMPGFTTKSMYPRMWAETGITYPELIDELIQLALSRSTGLR